MYDGAENNISSPSVLRPRYLGVGEVRVSAGHGGRADQGLPVDRQLVLPAQPRRTKQCKVGFLCHIIYGVVYKSLIINKTLKIIL